jgi:branched-chain amino acid transport system ATP-binding protein
MLCVRRMSVMIGALRIVRDVSLEVGRGSRVGLVGRNGAGKTTTMRGIMGLAASAADEITLGNKSLMGLRPQERARCGIGYVPEDRRLIGNLTVEENILVPAWALGQRGALARLSAIYELLPAVAAFAGRKAMLLSGGQQKLVALARGLMNATNLLLIDEPFEGLAEALAVRVADAIRQFQAREESLAILIAESDARRARMLAERVYVIERGEIVGED